MQPSSPNPNFDFIMNSGQQPKKNIFSGLGLPRPVLIGVGATIVVMVLIVGFSLLNGSKKSGTTGLVGIMAQSQEIIRVSGLASHDSQDPDLLALSSTVSSALTSEQSALNSYVAKNAKPLKAGALSVDQNSDTDAKFQTAAQNNNLPSVYDSYLIANLNSYKSAVSAEYNKTSNSTLKSILADAFNSTQTILSSLQQ